MRRGTPAAEYFGGYLRQRRLKNNLTLAQVAKRLGTFSSVPSQIETGARYLKQSKIDEWAKAYGIGVTTLRAVWRQAEEMYPEGPIVRHRSKAVDVATLETLVSSLNANQRSRVQGYIEALLEEG